MPASYIETCEKGREDGLRVCSRIRTQVAQNLPKHGIATHKGGHGGGLLEGAGWLVARAGAAEEVQDATTGLGAASLAAGGVLQGFVTSEPTA